MSRRYIFFFLLTRDITNLLQTKHLNFSVMKEIPSKLTHQHNGVLNIQNELF